MQVNTAQNNLPTYIILFYNNNIYYFFKFHKHDKIVKRSFDFNKRKPLDLQNKQYC